MLSNLVRSILIAASTIFGLAQILRGEFYSGALFLMAAALLIYGHFRAGPVWLIFRQLKRDEIGKAERLLNTIKNPELLAKQQRAYYWFSKALIEDNKSNFEQAEFSYDEALRLGLRTSNDTSIAWLKLAHISYRLGRYEEAETRVQQASKLTHHEGLDEEIRGLQNALASKLGS